MLAAQRTPANPLNLIRLVPAEGAWVRISALGVFLRCFGTASHGSRRRQPPKPRSSMKSSSPPPAAGPLADLPGRASRCSTRDTLRDAGAQHFEDVLALVPNLNWAAGTSRPRYFQLRGIGEVQQYQGAPNPSVGFLIDDIDFTGVGCRRRCSTSSRSRCCAGRRAHLRRQRAGRTDQRAHARIPARNSSCTAKLTGADLRHARCRYRHRRWIRRRRCRLAVGRAALSERRLPP